MSLVSVIIPAYNAAPFLQTTIHSVMAQTYTAWECIVVDDGSTDDTAKIAVEFVNSDSRIKYFHKENGGLSSARNFGLEKSTGVYVQFLDADDILFPEKLEKMVMAYAILDKKDVLFCDYIYGLADDPYQKCETEHKLFRDYGKEGLGFDFKKIYKYWDVKITIPVHCFLFPADAIKGHRFDESLKSKEDWDFHLGILRSLHNYRPINFIGCSYRSSDNSMSRNQTTMILSSIYVLHKRKYNYWTYTYRLAYYFCQKILLQLKGEQIDGQRIRSVFKALHGRYAGLQMFCCFLLLPFAFTQKALNFIRIRS
ncbi:glycosyltransferase family 2 protein [Taibaiella soli]|uniref:Glycosyltransferase 2-like domain-containing protein n=1 Tax=Taibaiella soli TaxID=1649169 RepID=A0A2W2AAH8_9BACT|nr:glycosyltransferase family 2 protein [Taibaiella soli]PZF72395.1 hypothetical protein DN068_13660 [Taibaiella soli]